MKEEAMFSALSPCTAPVQNAAASQGCFTTKTTSGEQIQVLSVHLALRPMFPQQGEPMAGYKPAPLGMKQIPEGARVAMAPDVVLLLSRMKLALHTEVFLKYKVC